MNLTKHHGLGNDFLIAFVDAVPTDAPAVAMELCNRRTGIGADGLIFGIDNTEQPIFRLFNSDGSSAEVSGNGLRCFVQALAMRRGVTALDVTVETLAGPRVCQGEQTADPAEMYASADMGPVGPGDQPDSPDFLTEIEGLGVIDEWGVADVGNPHVVIRVPEPEKIDLAKVGPQIEAHFPHGVNAHFVRWSGADEILLRVWERGAGATQACGSGATVSAQMMHTWGHVGPSVRVNMPGGSVNVDVATTDRPSAVLLGTARFIGTIQVPRG